VAGYLYRADGTEVYWSTSIDVPVWTAADIQAGDAAQSVKSITSDGNYLYAALGSNGLHRTLRGAAVSAEYSALSCTLVRYVNGRLMAANGQAIYNVTASGAAPSALYTHPNTDFTWVDFAGGPSHIYAAGYSGDKSLVYRTAVLPDGTALDIPTVAGELPDGEIVRSIKEYLSYLCVGTDKGVRFAAIQDDGSLLIGGLIETNSPVRCFEGQERFVWFGWENYDGGSTGLGRMDLSVFTEALRPAYASDLMYTSQGQVLSVVTFAGRQVFAVSGVGFVAGTADKVASGSLDSGLITFGMADKKIAANIDLRHEALPAGGSIDVWLSADDADFELLGSSDVEGATYRVIPALQTDGERFELRLVLNRATLTTAASALSRITFEANPAPGRGEFFSVPLLLFEYVETGAGGEYVDVATEYQTLVDLEASGLPFTYTDALGTETVHLQDHDFRIEKIADNRESLMGTFIAVLKRPRRRTT
jgi:hypothetical protein